MPHTFQGDLSVGDARFAIVISRYNDSITKNLMRGALDTLSRHGVADESIDVVWTPGAWEIPLAAQAIVRTNRVSAIICLGAVIRGETTHDQHINRQVSMSLGKLSLDSGLPIAFGVLTTNNLEQAIHRSGGNSGNKGIECALAALEMVSLLHKLSLET